MGERQVGLVLVEGIEPTRPCGHRILSPARLPVPPHQLWRRSQVSTRGLHRSRSLLRQTPLTSATILHRLLVSQAAVTRAGHGHATRFAVGPLAADEKHDARRDQYGFDYRDEYLLGKAIHDPFAEK
jgi:hypothetical protein